MTALNEVLGFAELNRVTSDCKPFKCGGRLTVCGECAAVQKIPNDQWLREISEIYLHYNVYSQGGGEEQIVLDSVTGKPKRRSVVLASRLHETNQLPDIGWLLDVGCGNGATLRAFSDEFLTWKLYGHDLDVKPHESIRKIPRFDRYFTGNLENIDDKFHLVSMIHSLEHFQNPLSVLKILHEKVHDDGHLFVEVCNVEENPFDLLVADHLMHFSPSSLESISIQAGFAMVKLETSWIKKELSMLSNLHGNQSTPLRLDPIRTLSEIAKKVRWLRQLKDTALRASQENQNFGIFGTSIAATWVANYLGDEIKYFVDEDPSRTGRSYMGKPVLAPDNVPDSATVFIALSPKLASAIRERLSYLPLKFLQMPAL
ncbi:MAG: methyltransferase domain-containing protein [Gammaproteobacteria bacterium]|nr:methyltransferase domain-containing protein [Gammaproteobacteria bacterium]